MSAESLPKLVLHDFLLQKCSTEPERLAFDGGPRSWRYADLKRAVDSHALTLQQDFGVARGERIILHLPASPAAIAAEMACSAVGAVFVPVSPETPLPRLAHIVASTRARLIIRAWPVDGAPAVPDVQYAELTPDGQLRRTSGNRMPAGADSGAALPTDLAYIIFTSGTTGAPKGIMMSHLAACYALHGIGAFGVSPLARVGTASPLQFDFSLLDVGCALRVGAAVVHVPRTLLYNARRLLRYLVSRRVNHLSGAPSLWRPLWQLPAAELAELPLDTLVFGGEAMSLKELERIRRVWPHVRLVQLYGQTESIACSHKVLPETLSTQRDRLSCGRAMPGAEVVVLAQDGTRIRTPGEVGEAYVRGPCLFSGYWQDPEATRATLVPDPIAPESGQRALRSGDLVYLDEEGEIYFARRRDTQVKVLGNRVELDDVDHCIERMPGVLHSATILDDSSEPPRLVSFIVLDTDHCGADMASDQARPWCARELPNYMTPALCVPLSELPMTNHGKVDRAALKRAAAKLRRSSSPAAALGHELSIEQEDAHELHGLQSETDGIFG